jgi:hypothetical protein
LHKYYSEHGSVKCYEKGGECLSDYAGEDWNLTSGKWSKEKREGRREIEEPENDTMHMIKDQGVSCCEGLCFILDIEHNKRG